MFFVTSKRVKVVVGDVNLQSLLIVCDKIETVNVQGTCVVVTKYMSPTTDLTSSHIMDYVQLL